MTRHPHAARNLLLPVALLFIGGALTGCANPYWNNRKLDAMDPFVFGLEGGPGIHAEAQLMILHTGLGHSPADERGDRPKGWGFYRRYGCIPWEHEELHAFFFGYSILNPEGEIPEVQNAYAAFLESFTTFEGEGARVNTLQYVTDVHISAKLWTGGLRIGVHPLELVDMVLGFTTLDLMGDDPGPIGLVEG